MYKYLPLPNGSLRRYEYRLCLVCYRMFCTTDIPAVCIYFPKLKGFGWAHKKCPDAKPEPGGVNYVNMQQ